MEAQKTKVHYNVLTDHWHTSKDCAGTTDDMIFSGPYPGYATGKACKRCGANELRKKEVRV